MWIAVVAIGVLYAISVTFLIGMFGRMLWRDRSNQALGSMWSTTTTSTRTTTLALPSPSLASADETAAA
ncbi:hypothetical protein [Rudaeicoccus suwonensis]|uniref:Uncharacterized protein n=1 Tax=Rudaeicoccus suwonensis TaxID=657409 RepID=A0A561E1H1_9MICO|nr:hypothetical protein [Rudaeicoccus suwonensis]TWE09454.1 hypothetical protein BKA23_3157 [Rudaeicoccus suwonensis]